MEMKQEFLIKHIIKALEFDILGTATRPSPVVKPLLHKNVDGPSRKHAWHYRMVIGMLNYLEKKSRPEIAMAVHQWARLYANPKFSHGRLVHRVIRYLIGTKDKGLVFKPDIKKGIECYVNVYFAGGWNSLDCDNQANILLRTGYMIFYAE